MADTTNDGPHNIEAEQALLGALLVSNKAVERLPAELKPTHFFDPLHGKIFAAITSAVAAGRTADPVTLKAAFQSDPPVEEGMSVPQYLGRLAANAVTIMNVHEYARTIIDLERRRNIIFFCDLAARRAQTAPHETTSETLFEELEAQLLSLAETSASGHSDMSLGEAARRAAEAANIAYQNKGKLTGVATGLAALDRKLGGLQPSDLIILGGRPSMGKTALATNIAFTAAEAGNPVVFFSLEMSGEQLADRCISAVAGVSSDRVRRGDVSEQEAMSYQRAALQFHSYPFRIDETGSLSIGQLMTRARRMARQHGAKLIVVDYLQLMGDDSVAVGDGKRT